MQPDLEPPLAILDELPRSAYILSSLDIILPTKSPSTDSNTLEVLASADKADSLLCVVQEWVKSERGLHLHNRANTLFCSIQHHITQIQAAAVEVHKKLRKGADDAD